MSEQPPGWVRQYVGLPYADRGRARDGLDCWGLIRLVYLEQYGVVLPSYVDEYATVEDHGTVADLFLAEARRDDWLPVPVTRARPPDVLTMRLEDYDHVVMLVADRRFLHILAGRETCVERVQSPLWRARVEAASAYRHRALDD